MIISQRVWGQHCGLCKPPLNVTEVTAVDNVPRATADHKDARELSSMPAKEINQTVDDIVGDIRTMDNTISPADI